MSASPCPGLLENNDAPLDTEIPLIQAFLSEQQSLLETLDSQIASSSDSIQRQVIVDRIEAHTAVLSPLRRVPAELWSKIFLLVPCTRRVGDTYAPIPPWVLGHICRLWRDMALANPFLWHAFQILPVRGHTLAALFPLAMIETQLARSASVDIVLAFEWSPGDVAAALLERFILESHRWNSVYIRVLGRSASVLSRLQQIRGRIPALKAFKFVAKDEREEPDFLAAQDIFLSAPSLCDFTLTHYKSNAPPFLLPSHQLVAYEGNARLDVHLSNLSTAHNLLECRLGPLGFMDEFSTPQPNIFRAVITLPRLQFLRVVEGEMINNLTAPVLTYLRVEAQLPTVLSFVQRSACGATLTTLILIRSKGSLASTFRTLLRALPELEFLVYDPTRGEADKADLADALILTGVEAHDVCRKLQTLAWSSYGTQQQGYRESMRRMVESRARADPEFVLRVLSVLPVEFDIEGMGMRMGMGIGLGLGAGLGEIPQMVQGGPGMVAFVERLGLTGLEENVEIVDWQETAKFLMLS